MAFDCYSKDGVATKIFKELAKASSFFLDAFYACSARLGAGGRLSVNKTLSTVKHRRLVSKVELSARNRVRLCAYAVSAS